MEARLCAQHQPSEFPSSRCARDEHVGRVERSRDAICYSVIWIVGPATLPPVWSTRDEAPRTTVSQSRRCRSAGSGFLCRCAADLQSQSDSVTTQPPARRTTTVEDLSGGSCVNDPSSRRNAHISNGGRTQEKSQHRDHQHHMTDAAEKWRGRCYKRFVSRVNHALHHP